MVLSFSRPSNFTANKQTRTCGMEGSLVQVSGKLPTYPSPNPTFCPKGEVSVNVDLGEG